MIRVLSALVAFSSFVATGCSGDSKTSSNGGGSPVVALSSSSVSFTSWTGKTLSDASVTISNSGGGTLSTPSASVQSGATWLTASVSAGAGSYSLTVHPLPGSLSPGTYTATVTVSAAGATSATLTATLEVTHSWTVFVYGHADHNLSPSLLVDMQEMNKATITPNVNIIVAADYSSGLGEPYCSPCTIPWTGAALPSGTEWYRIIGGNQPPTLIGTDAEANFDDPAVLRGALAAVLHNYPADRYGVVLWDHGGSWQVGFGGDWGNAAAKPVGATPMRAPAVAAALTGALSDAGITGAKPFEFVAFDTCLMAASETAYEFRALGKTYLACAEIDYGNGWDYTPTWTWLTNNPTSSAVQFAQNEVTYWNAHHATASVADRLMRAHVGLDMAKFDTFASAWKAFTTNALASSTLSAVEFARAEYETNPGYWFASDPNWTAELRDVGLFLSKATGITSDATVAGNAATAAAALSAAIIGSSLGSIRTAAGQKGVHLELPMAKDWAPQSALYKSQAWDSYTGWSGVLDALATNADSTAPTLSATAVNTSNPNATNTPEVTFSVADTDVAETRVYLARVENGSVLFYGLVGQNMIAPATAYTFTWRGRVFVLTDGATASYITLEPWIGGASPVYLAPGTIGVGGSSVDAIAAIDGTPSSKVVSYFVSDGLDHWETYNSETLSGATFTPTVYEAVSQTMANGTPLSVTTTPLTATAISAPAGSYRIVISASDVWANWGSAIADVTVVTPF